MARTDTSDPDSLATLLKSMENDHCAMPDSAVLFKTPNGMEAISKVTSRTLERPSSAINWPSSATNWPSSAIDWPSIDWPSIDWPSIDWPSSAIDWPSTDWPSSASDCP